MVLETRCGGWSTIGKKWSDAVAALAVFVAEINIEDINCTEYDKCIDLYFVGRVSG